MEHIDTNSFKEFSPRQSYNDECKSVTAANIFLNLRNKLHLSGLKRDNVKDHHNITKRDLNTTFLYLTSATTVPNNVTS